MLWADRPKVLALTCDTHIFVLGFIIVIIIIVVVVVAAADIIFYYYYYYYYLVNIAHY